MTYDSCLTSIKDKGLIIMRDESPAICNIVRGSMTPDYLQPEFDAGINFTKNLAEGSKILILASWLSLMTLEIFNRSTKVKEIVLLDHDKSVIKLGKKISTLYPSMSITYIRKNVVFDDISEYIDDIDDFIKHYGYDKDFIMDFVDLDEVTDIVVNSDGYGNLLNSYDGEMFETQVNGDWYFVMRAS